MPSLTKSPVSICTRSTEMLYSAALAATESKPPKMAASIRFFMKYTCLFKINIAVHPRLVVPRHITGKFEVGFFGEGPHDLFAFTRLQQDAVGIVMLHGVAIAHVHFHHLAIDVIALEHAVLNHHLHFLLMGFMHGRCTNIELVKEPALVLDHKTNSFTGFYIDRLRLIVIVMHFDIDGSGGFRRLPGLTTASSMPTTVGTGSKSGRGHRH